MIAIAAIPASAFARSLVSAEAGTGIAKLPASAMLAIVAVSVLISAPHGARFPVLTVLHSDSAVVSNSIWGLCEETSNIGKLLSDISR